MTETSEVETTPKQPWPSAVYLGPWRFSNSYDDVRFYCEALRATLRLHDRNAVSEIARTSDAVAAALSAADAACAALENAHDHDRGAWGLGALNDAECLATHARALISKALPAPPAPKGD